VLMVKFRRSAVIALLPEGRHVPVHVTGKVGSTLFEGVDIIRVIK
jgi:aspartyl/asparaginyl beta-hydroxylase (cupin superfamily)